MSSASPKAQPSASVPGVLGDTHNCPLARRLSKSSFATSFVSPLLGSAGARLLSLPMAPIQLPLHAQRSQPAALPLHGALAQLQSPAEGVKPPQTPPMLLLPHHLQRPQHHQHQQQHIRRRLTPRAQMLSSLPLSVASTPSARYSAAHSAMVSPVVAATTPTTSGDSETQRRHFPLQAPWLLEGHTRISELALAAALATPPRVVFNSSSSSSSAIPAASDSAPDSTSKPRSAQKRRAKQPLKPQSATPKGSRSNNHRSPNLSDASGHSSVPASPTIPSPGASADAHIFSALKQQRARAGGIHGRNSSSALLDQHTQSRLWETRTWLAGGVPAVVGPGRGLNFRVGLLAGGVASAASSPQPSWRNGSRAPAPSLTSSSASSSMNKQQRPTSLDLSSAAEVLIAAAAAGAHFDDSDDGSSRDFQDRDVRMQHDDDASYDAGGFSGEEDDFDGEEDDELVRFDDGDWVGAEKQHGIDSEATAGGDESDDLIPRSQPILSSSSARSRQQKLSQIHGDYSHQSRRASSGSSTVARANSAPFVLSNSAPLRRPTVSASPASKKNGSVSSATSVAAAAPSRTTSPASNPRKRKSPASRPEPRYRGHRQPGSIPASSSSSLGEESSSPLSSYNSGSEHSKRARISPHAPEDDEGSPSSAGDPVSSSRRGHRRSSGTPSSTGRHRCDQCDYTSSSSSGLKLHMLVHTGQKPHACPICGRRFRQKHHMIGHTRIHSGEKPFVCHLCGRAHKDCSGLRSHFKRHHPDVPCPSASHYRDGVLIVAPAPAAGTSGSNTSATASNAAAASEQLQHE